MSINRAAVYLVIAVEGLVFLAGSFVVVTCLDGLLWAATGRTVPVFDNAYASWVMTVGFVTGRCFSEA